MIVKHVKERYIMTGKFIFMTICIGVLIALIGLVYPHNVNAEDFTFYVDVDIQHVHEDVEKICFICNVTNIDPTTATHQPEQIAHGETCINRPSNGNYTGQVTIAFNKNSDKSAHDAAYYECFIAMRKGNQTSGVSICTSDYWTCIKASPTPTTILRGELPE